MLKPCKFLSSFTQTGNPEYKARCDVCHNAYLRKISQTPHAKRLRNVNRRRQLRIKKQKAVDLLGGKCEICGYDKSLAALTFHHKNGDQKEFEIGKILNYSWASVLKELTKCRLLCFNCHMELEESSEET